MFFKEIQLQVDQLNTQYQKVTKYKNPSNTDIQPSDMWVTFDLYRSNDTGLHTEAYRHRGD